MIGIMFERYTTEEERDDAGHFQAVGEEVGGVGEECN